MEEIRGWPSRWQASGSLHLSATAFGGGVAEIIYALVPLMADAGLDAEWRIIRGADEFFASRRRSTTRCRAPGRADAGAGGGLPPLQRAERGAVRRTSTTS